MVNERKELLEAALHGYRAMVIALSEKITAIEKELRAPVVKRGRRKLQVVAKPKRKMSAAGRAAIKAAQRKRWAKVKAAKGEAA